MTSASSVRTRGRPATPATCAAAGRQPHDNVDTRHGPAQRPARATTIGSTRDSGRRGSTADRRPRPTRRRTRPCRTTGGDASWDRRQSVHPRRAHAVEHDADERGRRCPPESAARKSIVCGSTAAASTANPNGATPITDRRSARLARQRPHFSTHPVAVAQRGGDAVERARRGAAELGRQCERGTCEPNAVAGHRCPPTRRWPRPAARLAPPRRPPSPARRASGRARGRSPRPMRCATTCPIATSGRWLRARRATRDRSEGRRALAVRRPTTHAADDERDRR